MQGGRHTNTHQATVSHNKHACRRGAAYGLAGVVKGLQIRAFTEYGILATLKSSLTDKVRGFRVESWGFEIQASGFRVWGLGLGCEPGSAALK